jgi:hypothetical protein
MTMEAEWLGGSDPHLLLACAHGRVSDRKLRLFAAACCRRVWGLLLSERSRRAVQTCEQYADGAATNADLRAAYAPAAWLEDTVVPPWAVVVAAEAAAANAAYPEAADAALRTALWALDAVAGTAADAVADPPCSPELGRAGDRWFLAFQAARVAEKQVQCRLLRCIAGNPFRRFRPRRSWLTWHDGAVAKLARALYDGSRFEDLGVLADALEEAGCTDPELLGHCREPGPHARGCWALDAVLGIPEVASERRVMRSGPHGDIGDPDRRRRGSARAPRAGHRPAGDAGEATAGGGVTPAAPSLCSRQE